MDLTFTHQVIVSDVHHTQISKSNTHTGLRRRDRLIHVLVSSNFLSDKHTDKHFTQSFDWHHHNLNTMCIMSATHLCLGYKKHPGVQHPLWHFLFSPPLLLERCPHHHTLWSCRQTDSWFVGLWWSKHYKKLWLCCSSPRFSKTSLLWKNIPSKKHYTANISEQPKQCFWCENSSGKYSKIIIFSKKEHSTRVLF